MDDGAKASSHWFKGTCDTVYVFQQIPRLRTTYVHYIIYINSYYAWSRSKFSIDFEAPTVGVDCVFMRQAGAGHSGSGLAHMGTGKEL